MDFNNDTGTLSNVTVISSTTNNLTLTNSGALVLPTGDISQRPSFANGLLRYNSETGYVEAASGSVWVNITTAAGGAPSAPVNSIQYNNAGEFGGESNLTYDATLDKVTLYGAGALQTRLSLLNATTTADATQVNKSALYIEVNGDAVYEGIRTYFKRSAAGISGWITYHYDGATPNIRITDEDDDPPYVLFNTIGTGTYDAPQYSNYFGSRGPTAGATTGFEWRVNNTAIATMDSQFFKQPTGTTAQRPVTATAGMTRFNTTLGRSEEYNGTYWKPVGGVVLQIVTGTIASTSGTTVVPLDNTTPTSTEGFQIWTQSFTPLSATSRIKIEYTITASHSTTTTTAIASLFAGATNIGTVAHSLGSNRGFNLAQSKIYSPGSTAAITFTARIGPQAGTVYVNNIAGTTLGGALVSNYTITEIE